jgi:hypothetical protein
MRKRHDRNYDTLEEKRMDLEQWPSASQSAARSRARVSLVQRCGRIAFGCPCPLNRALAV